MAPHLAVSRIVFVAQVFVSNGISADELQVLMERFPLRRKHALIYYFLPLRPIFFFILKKL
jgi:hypothetical protein